MSNENLNRLWLGLTALLLFSILAFSLYFALKRDRGQEVRIAAAPAEALQGTVLIDGAVGQPGFFPLKSGDQIDMLIAASGGLAADANLSEIRLYIPRANESDGPQKIDINRAEAWLLEALPEIGATKAQAIVQYREQNGRFPDIQSITRVPGISQAIFAQIKDLIAVSAR